MRYVQVYLFCLRKPLVFVNPLHTPIFKLTLVFLSGSYRISLGWLDNDFKRINYFLKTVIYKFYYKPNKTTQRVVIRPSMRGWCLFLTGQSLPEQPLYEGVIDNWPTGRTISWLFCHQVGSYVTRQAVQRQHLYNSLLGNCTAKQCQQKNSPYHLLQELFELSALLYTIKTK